MTEVSAGYFPDAITLKFEEASWGCINLTDVETAANGREVRRALYGDGGYRTLSGKTTALVPADAQLFRDFMRARRGRRDGFYIFAPDPQVYVAESCATGDGSASSFTLPFKSGTFTVAYVDGVSKAFSITAAYGSGGEDRLNFTAYTPALGAAITITGTARERILVRSNLDTYERPVLATPDYRTVWAYSFKEVK